MKQFIVLISTICLGILISSFIMGFKGTANDLNNTALNSLNELGISAAYTQTN